MTQKIFLYRKIRNNDIFQAILQQLNSDRKKMCKFIEDKVRQCYFILFDSIQVQNK